MSRLFDVAMRTVCTLIGLLLVAMGAIWIMQGLNVGPAAILQGFMVNDIQWSVYGVILALVGIGQMIWANQRGRAAG